MKNQFQGIIHLMAKAFVESVHPGTWLEEGREKLAPSELEALVPGDWLPLVPTEKSIGQFWMQKLKLPWGFLETLDKEQPIA